MTGSRPEAAGTDPARNSAAPCHKASLLKIALRFHPIAFANSILQGDLARRSESRKGALRKNYPENTANR